MRWFGLMRRRGLVLVLVVCLVLTPLMLVGVSGWRKMSNKKIEKVRAGMMRGLGLWLLCLVLIVRLVLVLLMLVGVSGIMLLHPVLLLRLVSILLKAIAGNVW
jgi:hypothetical protein